MKKSIFLFFAAILCSMSIDAYAATQRYIYVGLSNNYHQWKNASQWGINHWGGTNGGVVSGSKITDLEKTITHSGCTFHMYRMYVYDDNKNFEFKGNDGWWDCKKENISISGTTGNALLFRDNDGGDGGNPTFYQTNYQEESTVSLSASSNSVSVGEEVTLTPTLISNSEYNEITSTTYSVGSGATVSNDKFVATEAGTYTVTATITYNPKKFTGITKKVENVTCEIVVSEVVVPHPVTGVIVAPTSVTIKQGATTTLTATVSPSNADDPSITWSSDNTSVATVVNGVVTAVAAGTANITVTTVDGGFTATCAVKVKPLQYTFHAINSAQWPTVAAHYWGGADGGSSWPGADMVKESETINGCDIYSITISSDFVNIMFTNQIDGDKNKKTADLTTEGNNGKYYDIKEAKWYASLSEVPVSYDYYITGSFNGNNPKKAENGMTLDETVYKATVTLAAGDNTLKVTDGTWDKTWGANELGAAYEEVSNPNDYNNIKITLAAEKEITVIFDATAGKITFENLTPYVAPLTYTVTVPAGTEKCYIAGNMNGWEFQEMEAVTGETNKFTITIVGAKETDEYKYACQADWAYAEVIDGGGNRTNWSELDEVTAWNKPVVYTYYLMGVNDDWATGIEMTENPDQEGEYMLTCQPVNGQVKIKRVGDDDSEYWFGGKSLKEDPANLGTNTEAATDGDGNIELAAGKYNFYFNTADGKLWIAAATGCPATVTIEDPIGSMSTYTGVEENAGVWSKAYTAGDEVTIGVDQLGDGWLFAYWTVGGEKIFTEEYTFTVTEDVTITANYGMAMDVAFDNMVLDQDFWIVTAGPEAGFGIEVLLGIDVEGEHPKGFGLVDGSSISLGGEELELVTGYFTSVEPTIPSAEAVVFAVYEEMLMAFVCTMTAAPAPVHNIVVENATIDDQTETSGFLFMNGTWSDGTETYPVQAEIPGFDPNVASATYMVTITIGGKGDDDPWLGFGEGEVTVTVNDGLVTLSGSIKNAGNGFAADVTISGTLPAAEPETPTVSGKFSTGEYEYAEFALGNLQYHTGDKSWRFAQNQYDVIGEDNIYVGKTDYEGWIDMFGWSNGDDNNFGVNASNDNQYYTGTFVDWGTKMGEGWSTLSKEQWDYLLNERDESLKQIAKVGDKLGIMLFPDEWTLPTGCEPVNTLNHDPEDGENTKYDFYSQNYTLAQWTKLEKAGAVFLPAAGRRTGGWGNETVSPHMQGILGLDSDGHYKYQDNTNYYAYYWTSTYRESDNTATYLHNIKFLGNNDGTVGQASLANEQGRYGQSVRLAKVTSTLIEIGDDDNSAVITANAGKEMDVQVNRTFKANDGYYTICLPFNIDADEIGKAYQVTSITEHVAEEGFFMVFDEVETLIAGQPYLILPKNLTNPIFENVTIVNTTGETVEAEGAGIKFDMVGVINGGGKTDHGQYWVGDNGCFYDGDGTPTDKLGLRVLFNITDSQGQPVKVRARVVLGENTTTGLDNITNGEDTTIKVIENGQLVIIRNGEKFNAQGVRF